MQTTNHDKYWFASDNVAGVCPEAREGLLAALDATDAPYGHDAVTQAAQARLAALFETDCAVHFVATGTAANALALAALCKPYQSVLVHADAHVNTDECNAPEFFTQGLKLVTLEGERAKLSGEPVAQRLARPADVHFSPIGALSLTQLTEFGGLYSVAEISTLCELAHAHGARVHMDGARFANAVAALNCTPAELSWRAGVDILCFGGTKQGMTATEAVIIFDPELAVDFAYRAKQAGQLTSKMRMLAGPWLGMLQEDAWLRHARHANAQAARLAAGLARLPALSVWEPVQGNVVFVEMPDSVAQALHAGGWHFYRFTDRYYRLMCSWATQQAHIDALLAAIHAAI